MALKKPFYVCIQDLYGYIFRSLFCKARFGRAILACGGGPEEFPMLISPALAQTAGAASSAGDMFAQFMPLLLIFVVFYFLLIRPQQKKMKMQKAMLGALRRGDRVLTGGGIFGTISKIKSDTEVQVEIADGIKVIVARDTISTVMAKTEAADKASNDAGNDSGDASGSDSAESKGKSSGLKKLLGG